MTAITFDTLRFANRLKAAGVESAHAEAEAAALSEVLDTNLGELATKADLASLRSEMATKADLAALKAEMATKTDLAALKAEMATKTDLAALKVEMATKTDLAALKADMATKTDLAALRDDMATKGELAAEIALLRKDMLALEYRLTIKLGVLLAGSVAMLAAILKL